MDYTLEKINKMTEQEISEVLISRGINVINKPMVVMPSGHKIEVFEAARIFLIEKNTGNEGNEGYTRYF